MKQCIDTFGNEDKIRRFFTKTHNVKENHSCDYSYHLLYFLVIHTIFLVIPIDCGNLFILCHSHENANLEAFLHYHVYLNSESKKKPGFR